MSDLQKSLEQIEGVEWPLPTYDSALIQECCALRRKPIGELTPGNMRILIGQEIGLNVIVPLALQVLEVTPLIAADFYDGDLLVAVCTIKASYWQDHQDHKKTMLSLITALKELPEEVNNAVHSFNNGAV